MPLSTANPVGLNYYFNIQLLMAQGQNDRNYKQDKLQARDGSNHYVASLCAGHAGVDDQLAEALQNCKGVLWKEGLPVTICCDAKSSVLPSKESPSADSWVLRPCIIVDGISRQRTEHDPVGIAIRSPLFSANDSHMPATEAETCFGALRNSSWVHAIPSCRFNVSLRPMNQPMSLLQAKRLTTLVWIVEKMLPLRLSPYTNTNSFGRPLLVSTQSVMAKASLHSSAAARPADPLLAGIMDRHLPQSIHHSTIEGKLNRIWACTSMEHLATSLRDPDGFTLAFGFNLPIDNADGVQRDSSAMAVFRYFAVNHHNDNNAYNMWIELVLCLGSIMTVSVEAFKQTVANVNGLARETDSQHTDQAQSWKRVLAILGLSEDSIMGWETVVAEYDQEGKQGPEQVVL